MNNFKFPIHILFFLSFYSLSFMKGFCSLPSPFQNPLHTTEIIQGRSINIYLPAQYSQSDTHTQWTLIVLLHGYSSSGVQINQALGLSNDTSNEKFILAVPEGTIDKNQKKFWNATPFCCNFEHLPVDDVSFLSELIDKTSEKYLVDPQRVFIFGHSNGAFMANRLACEIPEKLAGIITLGGTGFWDNSQCLHHDPMNVLHIHGTNDQTISFEGSPNNYPGAIAMMERWQEINGCDPLKTETRWEDLEYRIGGKETEILQWSDCHSQKQTVLFQMKGVGHIPSFNSSFKKEVFNFIKIIK